MSDDERPTEDAQHVWAFDDAEFKEVRPGFRRRVWSSDDMMLTFWRIEEGRGPTPYDNHPDNEQWGIVLKGQLDFRIGSDERRTLGPGDVYWAPKGHDHGDSLFIGDPEHGETWILDIFTPPREEYLGG
ncbi:cupin domain-containing protein [Streptomyces uncialis]|uniref:cupin domain-containing protein n=1 Tax=Streptomyces uncialis TaxID=1048205 RepID=UPI003870B3EC|nr:cupin domain-containing protein [Streptomyces uncialis]